METRKVYMIQNQDGEYFKGKQRWRQRWSTFDKGRLFERKGDAVLAINSLPPNTRERYRPLVVEFNMEKE